VFFVNVRLKFASYFFENACKPFTDLTSAIENEVHPFVPVYDESGEPQFLQEWLDARTGFESVGLTALSMVASSLQLFLNDWVRFRLEGKGEPQYKRKHTKGWFHAYCQIFEEVGLNLEACPANLKLIEQAILARNRGQHPEILTMLQATHSQSDLEKYPRPYFVSETDQRIVETDNNESSWWLSPNIFVDKEKLNVVIYEIEKLCEWLEREWEKAVIA
jgi:hypothetical protein